MNDSVMMAELSWPEFAEKVKQQAIAFLPIGATEQHGPHMGLGVDVVLPSAVCERVARAVGGIVAPAIPYGYKSQPRSGGGQGFPGTIIGAHGIRRVVVCCGHFENVWAAIEGIDLALRDLKRDGIADMTVLRLEYWDFVRRETLDRLFPDGFPGTELEHAALIETSLMLLIRPDMVDMSKVPSDGPARVPLYDRYPVPAGFIPPSGVLARAERASAEKGQWLIDDHVELVAKGVREGFGL